MFIGDGAKLVRDAFELAKEKCKDQDKVSQLCMPSLYLPNSKRPPPSTRSHGAAKFCFNSTDGRLTFVLGVSWHAIATSVSLGNCAPLRSRARFPCRRCQSHASWSGINHVCGSLCGEEALFCYFSSSSPAVICIVLVLVPLDGMPLKL